MASDPMLLGVDLETPSQKNLKVKVVGCIFCAVMASMLLLNSYTPLAPAAAPGTSETVALAVGASPITSARTMGLALPRGNLLRGEAMPGRAMQDDLKMYGISSPLSQFAVTAIDANSRRDVSMKAAEVESGWSLVDGETKRKLKNVLEEVKFKSSALAGVTAPMNYFDPLGFSTTVTAGKLLFYREVELKHGRVSMLAALGILVGESFHPLFGGNIDSPAIYAFQETPLETFWPAVVAAIAIPEIYSVYSFQKPGLKGADQWTIREDHEPGNLGFDPLGLKPTGPMEL